MLGVRARSWSVRESCLWKRVRVVESCDCSFDSRDWRRFCSADGGIGGLGVRMESLEAADAIT